jgi:hypothetical protein
MEQETKQYTFQIGLDGTWDIPGVKFGNLSLSIGYMFEYIHNNGVGNDMFPRLNHNLITLNAEIDAAKAAWKARLHDTINNYIWIGARFVF